MEGKNSLDIFDIYNKTFCYVVKKYFKYFLTEEIEDNLIEKNLEILRQNFYNNFRVNILLIEDKGLINDLLDNLQKKITSAEISKKISDESYNSIWRFFVEDRKDIRPKYLLHIVPFYESVHKNPFRVLCEEDNRDI